MAHVHVTTVVHAESKAEWDRLIAHLAAQAGSLAPNAIPPGFDSRQDDAAQRTVTLIALRQGIDPYVEWSVT